MSGNISREEYLDAIRKLDEQTDGTPTIRQMVSEYEFGYAYRHLFETWHNALLAADIQPTHGVDQEVDREELLSELRRIRDEIGHSPTRKDVNERGQFEFSVYVEEFDSFITALKEAGIEPTELQYRFSHLDTPEEKLTTKNIEYLRENGPSPSSELPTSTGVSDKRHGMWKFTIGVGYRRGEDRGVIGGPAEPVYYLPEEHAPELVMRRFFEANPKVLTNKTLHGLKLEIRDYKKDWLDIAKEFLPELREDYSASEDDPKKIVIIDCPSNSTFQHCIRRTIRSPVDLDELGMTSKTVSGEHPVWGFTDEHADIWRELSKGDFLIFRGTDLKSPIAVQIVELVKDWNVGKDLWGTYKDGVRIKGPDVPWPYLIIGESAFELPSSISETLSSSNESKGVELVSRESLKPLIEKYGTVDAYLRDLRIRGERAEIETAQSPIEQRVIDLKTPLSEEPPLKEDVSEYSEEERKVRSEAFRVGISEIYPQCAICKTSREAPDGSTDIEAAHIYPKSESGPDILQNGLGLCRQHHWAFDAGWFTITKTYNIVINGDSSLEGFDEFKQFDGEKLLLPSNPEHNPHPKYLKAHQEIVE